MLISIIVSMAKNRVIGKQNSIPWHIPEDFRWFKEKTLGHTIIMGRKTYDSIGQPLPGRNNIIISRNPDLDISDALVCHSFDEALETAKNSGETEVFIIGGESIYHKAINITDRLYITIVESEYKGDRYFPEFDNSHFLEIFTEYHTGNPPFSFHIYARKPI